MYVTSDLFSKWADLDDSLFIWKLEHPKSSYLNFIKIRLLSGFKVIFNNANAYFDFEDVKWLWS